MLRLYQGGRNKAGIWVVVRSLLCGLKNTRWLSEHYNSITLVWFPRTNQDMTACFCFINQPSMLCRLEKNMPLFVRFVKTADKKSNDAFVVWTTSLGSGGADPNRSGSGGAQATGLRTERKQRPSLVSSRVKHMQGRGTASSRRVTVLNLHFFRWSAMLAMLANFHSVTVPKAVLKRHT